MSLEIMGSFLRMRMIRIKIESIIHSCLVQTSRNIMRKLPSTLLFTVLSLAAAGPVLAHGDVQCPASPKAEWRDKSELQQKLEKEGWQVRRVVSTKSCYEVYAKDPQGKRVEAFFDPKTLERVKD